MSKSPITPADRAHIEIIQLTSSLDKRTREYRRALKAERLIVEIRRSQKAARA